MESEDNAKLLNFFKSTWEDLIHCETDAEEIEQEWALALEMYSALFQEVNADHILKGWSLTKAAALRKENASTKTKPKIAAVLAYWLNSKGKKELKPKERCKMQNNIPSQAEMSADYLLNTPLSQIEICQLFRKKRCKGKRCAKNCTGISFRREIETIETSSERIYRELKKEQG